jgi:hypothetical protein
MIAQDGATRNLYYNLHMRRAAVPDLFVIITAGTR